MLALGVIGSRLEAPAAPLGIVSFEFCAWTGSCGEALSQWGARGRELFMLGLGLDCLFLLLYPAFIAAALLLADGGEKPRALTRAAVAAACAAGLLDACENGLLAVVVLDGRAGAPASAAAALAALKFALLAAALARLAALVARRAMNGASPCAS